MSAPKQNQFWKQRSEHGRDKLFESSELLWEESVKYFEATDKRKWIRKEFNGKDAVECEIPTETPYTWSGLCLFLNCGRNYFTQFEKENKDEGFSCIITRIREIIYTQKFEGAAVGAFNANIISRDLGLVDKQENKVHVEQPLFPDKE